MPPLPTPAVLALALFGLLSSGVGFVGPSHVSGFVGWVVGLVFVVVGVCSMLGLAFALRGVRTITVHRGTLRVRHTLGPIGFGPKLRAARIVALRLCEPPTDRNAQMQDLAFRLKAERTRSLLFPWYRRRVVLAEGDDPSWLHAWGVAIANELGKTLDVDEAARTALEPEADDGIARPVLDAPFEDPPEGVPFSLEVGDDSVTLAGTPDDEARNKAWAGILIGGFVGAFPLIKLALIIFNAGAMSMPLVLEPIGLAVLVGALLLVVHGWWCLRNAWIFDVTRDALLITTTKRGRPFTRTIAIRSVRTIRVGYSGMTEGSGDSKPILQLQIVTKRDGWIRVMTECSGETLAWVAGTLRLAMALDTNAPEER